MPFYSVSLRPLQSRFDEMSKWFSISSRILFMVCTKCLLIMKLKRSNIHVMMYIYLFVCAFECEEHVAHVARDENHGGECHAPADPLTPAREHIIAQFQGNHLHRAEQEDSLGKRRIKGEISLFFFFRYLNTNSKTVTPSTGIKGLLINESLMTIILPSNNSRFYK